MVNILQANFSLIPQLFTPGFTTGHQGLMGYQSVRGIVGNEAIPVVGQTSARAVNWTDVNI